MFTAYVAAAIVGLGMIVIAVIGGHDGGIDHAGDAHFGDAHADAGHFHAADWLPFLSTRFWIFFLAGFGMAGSLLTLLHASHEPFTAMWSALTGLLAGIPAAVLMRRLSKLSAKAQAPRIVGAEAEVLVPIREGQIGKIRIRLEDSEMETPALAEGGGSYAKGEEVIVVGIEGGSARIVRREEFYGT
jgi:membrane protein implicated in regulation of membrane protease activity